MERISYANDYCDCIEPNYDGKKYLAIGSTPNVADYQICDTCNLPIKGSQSTHQPSGGEI